MTIELNEVFSVELQNIILKINNIFKQIYDKLVLYTEKKDNNNLFLKSFPIILNYLELDLTNINNLKVVCKNTNSSLLKNLYIPNTHLDKSFYNLSDNTKFICKNIHMLNMFTLYHKKNGNLYQYIVCHINNHLYNITNLYIDLNSITLYLLQYKLNSEYSNILSITYNDIFYNFTYLKLNNLQSLTINFINNQFINDIYIIDILKIFPNLKYLDFPIYNIYYLPFIKQNYPQLKTLKLPSAIYDDVENNFNLDSQQISRLTKWQKKIFTDEYTIIKYLDELKLDISIVCKFLPHLPKNKLKKISITNTNANTIFPTLIHQSLLERIITKIIQQSPNLKCISLHFTVDDPVQIIQICENNNIHLNLK